MTPTDYFLDKFVAHKISSLTQCGAPELSGKCSWLNAFILNNTFRVELLSEKRAYFSTFIRRAEGAFFEYREARASLMEYVATPKNVVSPYFRSLLNFEVCVSLCWQCCQLYIGDTGQKLFKQGNNNEWERLHGLYMDAKHAEDMIAKGKLPGRATAAVRITNNGLEGSSCPAGLSFTELVEILKNIGEAARNLSRLEPAP